MKIPILQQVLKNLQASTHNSLRGHLSVTVRAVMLTDMGPASFWVLVPITLNIFKYEYSTGTHWNFIKTLKGPTVENSSQQHCKSFVKHINSPDSDYQKEKVGVCFNAVFQIQEFPLLW